MSNFRFSDVGVVAIVYFILALIGLYVVYRLLRTIVRKLVGLLSNGSVFGGDQKTRLIGLGIVALLFPGIFVGVGSALISIIGNFFVDVPRDLILQWQSSQSMCTAYTNIDLSFCTTQLGYGFVQAWTSAIADTLERFGPTYIPYGRLVLMLAVWAGISMLLKASTAKEHAEGEEQSTRLQVWFRDLKSPMRENLLFFLVLVVAGYLSIAAITAIPGLEESAAPAENVSLAQLQKELDVTRKQYVDRIPEQINFAEAPATATAVPTPKTTPSPEVTNSQEISVTTEQVNERILGRRENWQSQYSFFLETTRSEAEKSITDALSSYQASLIGRKGAQETVQHFLALEAWYRDGLSRMEQQLRRCQTYTKNLDRFYVSLPENQDPVNSSINYPNLQRLQQNQTNACAPRPFFERMPIRQELGSNLGPFSYIASWLLRTESLPLAQIVGLLGFGLLGSAVSSLVRTKKEQAENQFSVEDQPLVNELATVIIRGATAAVVVFLAVKGGLAVFTSGESNPNSYVLLLTCLIAAVFSEKIWEEAQNWLNRQIHADPNAERDTTPPPPNPQLPAPQEPTAGAGSSQETPPQPPPAEG